jgi:hypothetical protein
MDPEDVYRSVSVAHLSLLWPLVLSRLVLAMTFIVLHISTYPVAENRAAPLGAHAWSLAAPGGLWQCSLPREPRGIAQRLQGWDSVRRLSM